MFKIVIKRGNDFLFESEPMEIPEALDVMRVLMKPSAFGTAEYSFTVSKV